MMLTPISTKNLYNSLMRQEAKKRRKLKKITSRMKAR
jgi:hypothetical protein